jgi:hypothetical protein
MRSLPMLHIGFFEGQFHLDFEDRRRIDKY